jgi:hypothetical protein
MMDAADWWRGLGGKKVEWCVEEEVT